MALYLRLRQHTSFYCTGAQTLVAHPPVTIRHNLSSRQPCRLLVIPAQAGIHALELGTGLRRCDGISIADQSLSA